MRAALVFTSLTALSACTVGPDYRRPTTPSATVAEANFVSATRTVTSSGSLPDRWWNLYDDPALDRLVMAAFAANTDLRQALARVARARAVLAEAKVDLLPSTALSGGARYARGQLGGLGLSNGQTGNGTAPGGGTTPGSPGNGAVPGGGVAQNTNTDADVYYSGGAAIAYEVDLFGRVRRQIEAARADVDAQAAAANGVRVVVAAETIRAYTGACASGAQLIVARQSLRLAEAQAELGRRQVERGALAGVQARRLQVVAEQVAATIPPLENTRRAALFNLALLSGKAPAEVDATAEQCAHIPVAEVVLPVGDGRALLARRPDVREAERRLAAATAQIGVETAGLYPTITLGASVNGIGTNLGSAVSRQGLSFALGPLISWAFPNVAVARSRIAQAQAGRAETLAAFDGTVLTALNEVERALTAYATEIDRNAALRRAAAEQDRAFRVVQGSARFGAAAPIDVLDAERVLIETQTELAASDSLLADRRIDVFRALGGGWQLASPPPEDRPS